MGSVDTARFDYDLPAERIAQHPAAQRDQSRLMVVDRNSRTVEHALFRELPRFLPRPTTLFRNNARVLPARLRGRRAGGGAVEILLLRPGETPDRYWALVKPARRLRTGDAFVLDAGPEVIIEAVDEASGARLLHMSLGDVSSVAELAQAHGELPLPPYIERLTPEPDDRSRYQTVYAATDRATAAAAPTAGLHFTPELLAELERDGVRSFDLTLHVGLDTFRPIQSEQVEAHVIHREAYEIPAATREALETGSGARLAVGTTSLRSIEDYARKGRAAPPGPWVAEADLYVYPPAKFAQADALITNFHLPRSTLLCLVSAFLTPGSEEGIEWLLELYRDAIARDYRFFSHGDAMLIL